MTTLRVRQDIGLIFIVTESLKARLVNEATEALENVKTQIGQFDFRAQHALADIQRTDLSRAAAARQQIEVEKRRLEAMRNELNDRKREMENLQIGCEYAQGALEGSVEVKVGDNLFEKIVGFQLVVKDGIIQDIRQTLVESDQVMLPSAGVDLEGGA